MKVTPFEGTVESAYGVKLETAVRFKGTYEKLEDADASEKDALIKTQEWPSDVDIISGYINPRRLAAARAKETTAALDAAGIKKPAKDDPIVLFKNMFAQLKLAKWNDEQANKMARQMLGDMNPVDYPDLKS